MRFDNLLSMGPQAQKMTTRIVPDTAPSIVCAINGDIEGLKNLFKRGLASPFDVSSTRGFSLIRVGVYSCSGAK